VDDTTKEIIRDAIRRGLEKYLSEETSKAIVDAINFDSLVEALAGEKEFKGADSAVDAVKFEQLGAKLGEFIAGKAAKKAAKRGFSKAVPGGPFTTAVGGLVGKRAMKALIRHTDWEEVERKVGNRLQKVKIASLKRLKAFAKKLRHDVPRPSVSTFWSRTKSKD
jgi:hypothetical protein